MKTQSFDLDNYIEAWNTQTISAGITETDIVECIKRRYPHRNRYRKMIVSEALALILSFVFLFFFIGRWESFNDASAPKASIMGAVAICIVAIADCVAMLFCIIKATSYEVTTLQMINNQRRLLKMERFEMLAIPIVLPFAVTFVLPALMWIFDDINIYTDLKHYWELTLTCIIVAVIAVILAASYIYRTSVRKINECIADLEIAFEIKKH